MELLVRLARIYALRRPHGLAESMNAAHVEHCWDFQQPGERARHARILELVEEQAGSPPWSSVLEVGCSDGVFTQQLASRCQALVAIDLSTEACWQARTRVGNAQNVTFRQMDILRQRVPGTFDVVFAMDILECNQGPASVRRAVSSIVAGLQRGGLLAYCGCHLPLEDSLWARLLWEGAPHTVRALSRHADLELVHVEEHPPAGVQYPDYIPHLMALFRKR